MSDVGGGTKSELRQAIDAFCADLLVLIRQAVAQELRMYLELKAHRRLVVAPPRVGDWPLPGTNCADVLEALRAQPEGMRASELRQRVRLRGSLLNKAIEKLRARHLVRRVQIPGEPAMRYYALPAKG